MKATSAVFLVAAFLLLGGHAIAGSAAHKKPSTAGMTSTQIAFTATTPEQAASAKPLNLAEYTKRSNPLFSSCDGWQQLVITVSAASNCLREWDQGKIGFDWTGALPQANTNLGSSAQSVVADSSQPAANPAAAAPTGPNPGTPSTCFNYNTGRLIPCTGPYATGPPQPRLQNPFFNPCGGWRQMLVSYAGATNCVMPPGDISLGGAYGATFIPATTQFVYNGNASATSTYAMPALFIPCRDVGVTQESREWHYFREAFASKRMSPGEVQN